MKVSLAAARSWSSYRGDRQTGWGGPEHPGRDGQGQRVGQDLSATSTQRRLHAGSPRSSGGETSLQTRWSCSRAALSRCHLTGALSGPPRAPTLPPDRLIKTRPGGRRGEDEDRRSGVKRSEEQLGSSSANKRAKREKGGRRGGEKRLWERVRTRSTLRRRERERRRTGRGIKRKA